MLYQMNEGQFYLPDDWHDESIHVLKAPIQSGINLVVSREHIGTLKDTQAFVLEQRQAIRDNLENFVEHDPHTLTLAEQECTLMDYSWQSKDGLMHQLNLLYVQSPIMLSFTFTSMQPFNAQQRSLCQEILLSFQPRLAE